MQKRNHKNVIPLFLNCVRPAAHVLHYFSEFTSVMDRRHAVIFLEKLAEIINILIADAVGDGLDALLAVGFKLNAGTL